MIEVKSARYISEYRLELEFSNGSVREVDLQSHLTGSVFQPLRDKTYFSNFSVQFNTVAWSNGADFAPEFLFEIGTEVETKKVA